MKSIVYAVTAATTLFVSFGVFAQSGITREQVRAELIQLQQAGYDTARGEDPYYPDEIQAALARIATQKTAAAQTRRVDSSDYGMQAQGVSESGRRALGASPASAEELESLYRGS
ncbi:MAG: DUF4148 domain-containing protein [Burkholderia sp.]|jgi:cytochrome c556|uniref:DUF4148 domain-containing protein n=1 Tax=Burkholderia sp. TaxID=36773 RepID=UPI00282FFCA9|nr:DUF4148 domain-containing protein [Burkholderia sp.]MDR0240439.1 DUF4148 domain-containing protein [Burkholderia sp.]